MLIFTHTKKKIVLKSRHEQSSEHLRAVDCYLYLIFNLWRLCRSWKCWGRTANMASGANLWKLLQQQKTASAPNQGPVCETQWSMWCIYIVKALLVKGFQVIDYSYSLDLEKYCTKIRWKKKMSKPISGILYSASDDLFLFALWVI